VRSLSLRRNFVWSITGTAVYNLAQWLLLVALARFGTSELVGEFALMLAISAPVYMTVGLNLRVVRATDVRRRWTPQQYHLLRLLLNVLSFVITLAIAFIAGFPSGELLVLSLLALSKAVETTSLLLYGFFQLRGRLDLVARSMLLRACLGSVLFVAGLILTGGLAGACAGLVLGWIGTWAVHDRPCEMRLLASESEAILADGALGEMGRGTIWSLARSAVPLGADTGVVSLATNAPRFAVQAFMGSSALGVFAALAYFTQVVSLVTGALGDSVVGPLAKQAARRDAEEFGRLLLKLATFAVVVSGASAVGAWVVGAWVLRLVLGGEYADRGLLVILMLGAGGITLQRSLGRGLQAAQQYSTLLLVDSLVLISTIVFALALTPRFGLDGAAAALGLGYVVGFAVSIVVMRRLMTGMRADQVRVTH